MSITFRNACKIGDDRFFIGIDQSMTHTGITIFKKINNQEVLIASKGFETNTELSFEERLLSIKSFLKDLILQYAPDETFIAIEGLAFNRSPSNNSAMLFGLFSVIITMLTEEQYRYKIVPPKTLKKFATNDGAADKSLMLNCIADDVLEELRNFSKVKSKKKFEDIVDSFWLSKYALN